MLGRWFMVGSCPFGPHRMIWRSLVTYQCALVLVSERPRRARSNATAKKERNGK